MPAYQQPLSAVRCYSQQEWEGEAEAWKEIFCLTELSLHLVLCHILSGHIISECQCSFHLSHSCHSGTDTLLSFNLQDFTRQCFASTFLRLLEVWQTLKHPTGDCKIAGASGWLRTWTIRRLSLCLFGLRVQAETQSSLRKWHSNSTPPAD